MQEKCMNGFCQGCCVYVCGFVKLILGEWVSKSHSVMSYSCDPMDCSCQAPLSVEFSRQEYWSGLPFPSPRDLINPGIELSFPAFQADSLPYEPPGRPLEGFILVIFVVVQSLSHLWLCDPMDYSMLGSSVLHYLLEFAQIHVHWVSDAI